MNFDAEIELRCAHWSHKPGLIGLNSQLRNQFCSASTNQLCAAIPRRA